MIAKGTPHRHGAVLARYLVAGKEREQAELLELRGFACTGIVAAFRSVHVMAAATRCTAPFFHVAVRNREGETLDRSQWQYAADRIERTLGLTDQPRAIAMHTADDTGHSHMHIAWSRINEETLTATPLPFFKRRLKQVCRALEERFGLTPVSDRRESLIHFAPTRSEEEQSRRLGLDIHAIRNLIRNCFEAADCGRSFQAALTQESLTLVRGDRRDFLVVDREGGLHALGKRVLGVSAAETRQRLADLTGGPLPTLDQARALITAQKQGIPSVRSESGLSHNIRAREHGAKTRRRGVHYERTRTVGEQDRRSALPCDAPAARTTDHIKTDSLPTGMPAPGENVATDAAVNPPPASAVTVQHESGVQHPADHFGWYQSVQPGPRRNTSVIDTFGASSDLPRESPTVQKGSRFGDVLKRQFRAAVKHLIGKEPAPRPSSRRQREDKGGGFMAVAVSLLRRARQIPPFHLLDPSWEPFTWLRLWEYNGPASMDLHQDSAAPPPTSSHTPHL
jgi:hypothetical protein